MASEDTPKFLEFGYNPSNPREEEILQRALDTGVFYIRIRGPDDTFLAIPGGDIKRLVVRSIEHPPCNECGAIYLKDVELAELESTIDKKSEELLKLKKFIDNEHSECKSCRFYNMIEDLLTLGAEHE